MSTIQASAIPPPLQSPPALAPQIIQGVPETSIDKESADVHPPPPVDGVTEEERRLPAYIQPLPLEWPLEDVAFLKLKGALSCPPTEFRDALINAYVSWVHAFCPVIDLQEFFAQVLHTDGSCGRVSLLVLQAVMFAGTAFVPFEYIAGAGYATRHDARDDFFGRVKLLYDFKYETDRIRTVQALLLMSYWQDKHDALQNHWYWVALANDVALSISLNQEPGPQLSASDACLRRRLGWTCFVRDRVLSVGLRQKPSLLLNQFTLRPLEVSDFDIRPFQLGDLEAFGQSGLLADPARQATLASLYVEKTKLCLILDRIFNSLYTDQVLRPSGTSELTTALVERHSTINVEPEGDYGIELQDWLANLPEQCRYSSSPSPYLAPADEIIRLHQAFVHMLYHTIRLAVYQPQLDKQNAQGKKVLRLVRLSSVAITRAAEDLYDYGILHLVQSAVVSMLVRAAVSHLYDYRVTHEGESGDQSVRRFLDTLNFLTQLTGIHKYAIFASSFLRYSAQKFGIPCQALLTGGLSWNSYGIWEDVHTPQRLIKDPPLPQNTAAEPNDPNMFPVSNDLQTSTSELRYITTDYTQLSTQVWDSVDNGDFAADSAYLASLDSWFRNCFQPLIDNN
ncbi:fungal-specific transcription factor domain-containing protein [Aspergillus germanicus]